MCFGGVGDEVSLAGEIFGAGATFVGMAGREQEMKVETSLVVVPAVAGVTGEHVDVVGRWSNV